MKVKEETEITGLKLNIQKVIPYIYGILKDENDNPICKTEKETQMYRTNFGTCGRR